MSAHWRRVRSALPPQHGKGWTVLLDCGHTLYDVGGEKRPKTVNCTLCTAQERRLEVP